MTTFLSSRDIADVLERAMEYYEPKPWPSVETYMCTVLSVFREALELDIFEVHQCRKLIHGQLNGYETLKWFLIDTNEEYQLAYNADDHQKTSAMQVQWYRDLIVLLRTQVEGECHV